MAHKLLDHVQRRPGFGAKANKCVPQTMEPHSNYRAAPMGFANILGGLYAARFQEGLDRDRDFAWVLGMQSLFFGKEESVAWRFR